MLSPFRSRSKIRSGSRFPRPTGTTTRAVASHEKRGDRRISVVGTIGSGKTTLASEISKLLVIPHIELDSLHWEPNWVEASDSTFKDRVNHSLLGASWVVDGNYHQVRNIVWSQADTVVWLDYPFRIIMSQLAR